MFCSEFTEDRKLFYFNPYALVNCDYCKVCWSCSFKVNGFSFIIWVSEQKRKPLENIYNVHNFQDYLLI